MTLSARAVPCEGFMPLFVTAAAGLAALGIMFSMLLEGHDRTRMRKGWGSTGRERGAAGDRGAWARRL